MKKNIFKLSLLPLLVALATGCGDDGDDGAPGAAGAQGAAGPAGQDGADGQDGTNGQDGQVVSNGSAVYTVTFSNLTKAQPMAPAAIILHEPGYHAFVDGQAASVAIEEMAEGGSPANVIADAQASTDFLDALSTGSPTPPGASAETLTLIVPESDTDNLRLTMTSMLVNTNDAFTALNAMDVSNMSVGQSKTFNTPTWDAGTEANTETAATMPGPAAGAAGGGGMAAGFDAARDDLIDRVHFHGGVVTADDGFATSVLGEIHRFDNPTARVVITRTR